MILFLGTAGVAVIKRFRVLVQSRSIWSLVDQGTVSLGNFLTSILLVRNLSQADYGSYVLAYGVLVFLNSIHSALVIYPLSVRGAVAEIPELRRLATASLLLTTILGLPFCAVVLAANSAIDKLHLAVLSISALFFWQVQESLRRALMSHLRQAEAVLGDAVSYLGQAGLVWILAQHHAISIESTFGIIALTSAAAAIVQAIQLGVRSISYSELVSFIKAAWNLGKWSLSISMLAILTIHATPWVLAAFHGSAETASVQAVINVVGVSNPIVFSIGNLVIPAVAKANQEGGLRAAHRAAFTYAAQGGVFLLPFYSFLLIFPRKALEFLYGNNSPYLGFETVLRLFVIAYILVYFSIIFGGIILGIGRSKLGFVAELVSVISAVCIGIPLTAWFGAVGAGLGNIFSGSSQVITKVFLLRRCAQSTSKPPAC